MPLDNDVKVFLKLSRFVFCLLCFSALASANSESRDFIVREGMKAITVKSTAPIPEEVGNDSQAKALAREAAVTLGQAAILNHILQKKTRSKKTLAEAEIPYIELQNRIRGIVKGAVIKQTTWENKSCTVTLTMDKKALNDILRKY